MCVGAAKSTLYAPSRVMKHMSRTTTNLDELSRTILFVLRSARGTQSLASKINEIDLHLTFLLLPRNDYVGFSEKPNNSLRGLKPWARTAIWVIRNVLRPANMPNITKSRVEHFRKEFHFLERIALRRPAGKLNLD